MKVDDSDEAIVHYDWEEDATNGEDTHSVKKDETKPESKPVEKKPKKKTIKKKAAKKQTAEHTKPSIDPSDAKKSSHDASNVGFYIVLSIIAVIAIVVAAVYLFPQAESIEDVQRIAATVNGEQITLAHVTSFYDLTVPPHLRELVNLEQFLETSVVAQAVLRQEAEKQGISATDSEITASIDRFKQGNQLDDISYMERLKQSNVTLDEVQAYYADQIMIIKLFNSTFSDQLTITQEEVAQYYEANNELFSGKPGEIRAGHILVNSSEAANEVHDLLQQGADFEELAVERSLDPSVRLNRGHLGFFGRGAMVPVFEEAAFQLEENGISLPVQTQFGYHVIVREPDTVPLEDAALAIVNALRSSKQESFFRTYIDQLKSRADIEIFLGKGELPTIAAEKEDGEVRLSFVDTGDDTCYENGKVVVRMFSASTCASCEWVREAYEGAVSEFAEDVVAYHWQLDSGDNLMTDEVETQISPSEVTLFKQYNPKSTVPTFVVGCTYVRVGNAFENDNNVAAEREEFKKIIEKLI